MPNTTSNTQECFSGFIGQKVVGVLFNALPPSRADIAMGTKALVFEDGYALVIAPNGSFWTAGPEEVAQAITRRKNELRRGNEEIEAVLALAGAVERARGGQE